MAKGMLGTKVLFIQTGGVLQFWQVRSPRKEAQPAADDNQSNYATVSILAKTLDAQGVDTHHR
jgi:hypothetical protein